MRLVSYIKDVMLVWFWWKKEVYYEFCIGCFLKSIRFIMNRNVDIFLNWFWFYLYIFVILVRKSI